MSARLNVNIDHVATVREARKTIEPSVVAAAMACEQAGADGITVHLRADRRHIQDSDVEMLRQVVSTYLNLEIAATNEMVAIATRLKPDAVSLVPESPTEITTEGGLDVIGNYEAVDHAVSALRSAGIFPSIFIDPDVGQIDVAKKAGAGQVELCTAEYAHLTLRSRATHGHGEAAATREIERIQHAATHAKSIGLVVAAGHGLTTRNIGPLAAMPDITEFNIGHHIISRAVFVGLAQAVQDMLRAIRQ